MFYSKVWKKNNPDVAKHPNPREAVINKEEENAKFSQSISRNTLRNFN